MADGDEDTRTERAPGEAAEAICRPCRGTGSVISGLGGEQRTQTCPWCGGSGVRQPERDAQEAGAALRANG